MQFENISKSHLLQVYNELEALDFNVPMINSALSVDICKSIWGLEFFSNLVEGKNKYFKRLDSVEILNFAYNVFLAKNHLGFKSYLKTVSTRNDWKSVHHEIRFANEIAANAKEIEFVSTSNEKKRDYDLKAYEFFGFEELHIEIKSRDNIFYKEDQLYNFLNKARKQLPPKKQGAIFMNIVLEEDSLSVAKLNDVIKSFLVKTDTVHFIFYSWDNYQTVKMDNEEKRIQIVMCSAFDKHGYVGNVFSKNKMIDFSLKDLILT